MINPFLVEVAKWSREALDEDNDRYFYHFNDITLIENGQKNYVIGRKGTGKTAIAEYIKSKNSNDVRTILLSFKNFPFNSLYHLKNESYTPPNQYITLWEHVIYTCICFLMKESIYVNYDSRQKLQEIFEIDIEKALQKHISKISDRGFNLGGFGISAGITPKTSHTISKSTDFSDQNEILKNFIINNICNSKYFIMFDSLDEDYKDIFNLDRKDIYFDLLVGLFKAAQNVRRFLNIQSKKTVFPLIFLREDIFDLCRDPDKNKWIDRAINLNWNSTSLQSLITFRLSRAMSANGQHIPFENVWSKFFETHTIRTQNRHNRHENAFKYMLRSTFNRPRDIINFFRECANISIHQNSFLINSKIIKDASIEQSKYIRGEIIDEVHSIIENISEILDMLSEIRKPIFSHSEFHDNYKILFENRENEDKYLKSEIVIQILYHYGAIGNVTTGNHQVYSYNTTSRRINKQENIVIHRSLLKVLDIF